MSEPTTLRRLAGLGPVTALERTRTALILIDFQMEYFTPGPLLLPGGPEAVSRAAELVAAADAAEISVIHVRHLAASPEAAAFAPGGPRSVFHPAVAPAANHQVVTKGLPSSFRGTDMDERLRAVGADTLVLAGLMTHMCLDTTARDAAQSGYRVLVAGDACASRDLPRPGGGVVSREQVHEAVLAALSDRFADVRPSGEILDLMRESR